MWLSLRYRSFVRNLSVPGIQHTAKTHSVPKPRMDLRTRVSVSEGQNEEELLRKLQSLLTDNGGLWKLTADGKGLERPFHFKTFNRTWVSFTLSLTWYLLKYRSRSS